LTALLIQFSDIPNLFAQNDSKPNHEILVCDFVIYCSNPIVMNMTLTQTSKMSQTNTTEVVSNISIMITPDLYNQTAR
jgi:hypothetical protein